MMAEYTVTHFENNDQVRWDSQEVEVSTQTVQLLRTRGEDVLEKALVHWGKGKGQGEEDMELCFGGRGGA